MRVHLKFPVRTLEGSGFIDLAISMTKLLSFPDVPALPLDILRLVFEDATRSDRHKAAKYTLISKLVCNWYFVIVVLSSLKR